MKGRWWWWVIGANLLALLTLVFVYPHLMVSPGPLIAGHAALNNDCFACHSPLRGASDARCISCHLPADIGLRSSTGAAISPRASASGTAATAMKMSFHQALTEQNCMACHSDHVSAGLTRRPTKTFSHELLRAADRERCDACHLAPATNLHRQFKGNCAQCHSSKAWTPATFDHDKLFLLDGDHNAPCATCHVGNNTRQYTCYGCHEHTPANVRREHEGEGIRQFDNCVECHRSADGEPDGSEGRSGQRERD